MKGLPPARVGDGMRLAFLEKIRSELEPSYVWTFLRKQLLTVLIGFVIAFVIYLFIRFDTVKVLQGLAIGLAAGIALAIVLFFLERRFPERSHTGTP